MASDVDICNRALLRVGQKQTISALDEDTTEAEACNTIYADVVDEVLADFPWAFAERHAVLALLGYARSGWAYAYAAPSDLIFPRYVFSGARPGALTTPGNFIGTPSLPVAVTLGMPLSATAVPVPFTMGAGETGGVPDGTQIVLTDQPTAELVYTARISIATVYPPLFRSALSWRLAAELALALPVKASLADWAEKQYRAELLRAGAASFRGTQEDPEGDASHISVR